jgi:hypothetical protein
VRSHKVVNDMFRSFDLENNHQNLEEQKYDPFDDFNQLHGYQDIRSTYHTKIQITPRYLTTCV